MNKLLLSAAVAGVLAATSVMAEDAAKTEKVKCQGIAKAGKNDCKTNSHSCAGQAKADNAADEWKFADSAEACEKEGGKVAAEAPKAN